VERGAGGGASVPRETLAAQVERFGLDQAVVAKLAALLTALAAEPDPHTSVSDPVAAADVHVADSLVALEAPGVRAAQAIADIGAGAGFPGLALAAALPSARVDLIESQRRKCAVIERLALAAGLDRARAVPARAEDWGAGEGASAYDLVTARAVASLAVLVEYAAPLLTLDGTFIAWKGTPDPEEEDAGNRAASEVGLEPGVRLAVTPYPASTDRHLYLYRKSSPTPERFPRRPGMAAKRPLAR
jgi:16S rRNA (guanine527-N7)-methyltransferase